MNSNDPSAKLSDILLEAFLQDPGPQLKSFLEDMEKHLIVTVLERVHGNQKEAARILGVKYTTLNEKVKRYDILFKKTPILDEQALIDLFN